MQGVEFDSIMYGNFHLAKYLDRYDIQLPRLGTSTYVELTSQLPNYTYGIMFFASIEGIDIVYTSISQDVKIHYNWEVNDGEISIESKRRALHCILSFWEAESIWNGITNAFSFTGNYEQTIINIAYFVLYMEHVENAELISFYF